MWAVNEHETTKEEDSGVANRLLQRGFLFPTACLLSHIIVKNVHDLSHLSIKFTDSLHRRFDAYHRLNVAICRSARTEIQPFSATSKKGEFMSRSVFRANLCVGKRGFDSSIQAQGTGEFMRRKRRIYGNSDNVF